MTKRHIRRAMMAAGTALGLTGPGWAHANTGYAVSEAHKDEREEVITITATRNPRPAFDYPGQVSVIEHDAIETYAPSDLDDVLRAMPGVTVGGGPRRTGQTVSIRGLGGENVLILIDGARQSFTSAHDGRVFLDPELLQSIEAVRGPASALYGSGAMGGVLTFNTARATHLLGSEESFGYRLRSGYETSASNRFAIATAYGRSGGFDGLISLGGRRSGDIALATGIDLPADDDITTWLGNGGYHFEGLGEVHLAAHGFRNIAIEPNNGQGARIGGGTGLDADVKKIVDTDTLRFGARLNPDEIDWLDANLMIYRTQSAVTERELTSPRSTARDIETTGLSIDNRTAFSLFGAEALMTVGADWWRDEQIGRDTVGPSGTRDGVPDGRSEFRGAYVQVEVDTRAPFSLPGTMAVIPGVRFDSYENTAVDDSRGNSDERVSGRFSARYAPNEAFFVYSAWAQGFRTPSINELYLDGIHFSIPLPPGPPGRPRVANNTFTPNPNLRPEISETTEVGFGLDMESVLESGDALRFKIGWWQADIEDLISIAVIGGGPIASCFIPPRYSPCNAGTTESQNVRNAKLDGLEVELQYSVGPLSLSAAYSDVEGKDARTGAPVGVLAPSRLIGDLRYSIGHANLTLGLRTEVAGKFEKTNLAAERRDGYTLIDAFASWRPTPSLRIDAGIDNITDEVAERIFAGVPEPSRSVRIAVTWSQGF